MEIISLKEAELMTLLRERVNDLSLPPEYLECKNLVRWIRARGNKVDEAEKMLRDHISWRNEFTIDTLAEKESYLPLEYSGLFKFDIYGFDDTGGVVNLIYGNTLNFETALKLGLKDTVIQHSMANCEKGWRLNVKNSKGKDYIAKSVSIYDLNGTSISQLCSTEAVNFMMNLTRMIDVNYPECVKRIFVVNAPWGFQIIWRILKAVISERTTKRLDIIGYDKNEMRTKISQHLKVHQFPQKYGGDGDDAPKELRELEESYDKRHCESFRAH